jgi:hypothetical protein
MSNKRHLRIAVLSFLCLVVGFLFSACGSGGSTPNNDICCDDGTICFCYPNQSCYTYETRVSRCPQYGYNCLDTDGSDFCTSWDLPCYDTASNSTTVSSCP